MSRLKALRGLALPLLLIAAWWLAFRAEIASTLVFPSPARTEATFAALLKSGELLFNIRASLLRVVEGFALGASLGLLLGILMGLSKAFERLVLPTFNAVRQVPIIGWLPMMIVWFGIGEPSKVIFIAAGAFFPAAFNTHRGVKGVAREYIEVAQAFECGKLRMLATVILPAALPSILTGLRFSLSTSWMLVVAAELVMLTAGGIGNMMAQGRELFQMDIVLVGMAVIGAVGFVMNHAIKLLEARLATRGA